MWDGAKICRWLTACLVIGGMLAPTTANADHRPQLTGNDWLSVVNFYRATAGVPKVTVDAGLSRGAYLHSRYVVMNQHLTHYEDPGLPYYTSAGAAAGRSGNVAGWSSTGSGYPVSERSMIEEWMIAPFHAEGIIRRGLKRVGFGTFRHPSKRMFLAATLDVLQGLDRNAVGRTIVWPAHGTQVPLDRYTGNELPDPLKYCKGYRAPTGLPLVVIPERSAPLVGHSFSSGGRALDHCAFRRYGSLFLIPKAPLQDGARYDARLKTTAETVKWSFTVGEVEPPTGISLARFERFFQEEVSFGTSWDARDDESGIAHFEVKVRTSVKGASFGSSEAWLPAATERQSTFTGVPGNTYCFTARAWDKSGNHSRLSAERCTALPLGALDLSPSLFWFPSADPRYYQGLAYTTIAPGQTLTIRDVKTKRLALVATRCSGCGSVEVRFAGEKIGEVDLDAAETENRQLIPLAEFGDVRSGDVVITVTSTLADVIIEGLAISRI